MEIGGKILGCSAQKLYSWAMIYRFDRFELDLARFELREENTVHALEPQVFALLAYLIEHLERLVPKNELFEKLWEGRVVTDSALTSRVKAARRALSDTGKAQKFIKTIYGKGFRFVADVQMSQGAGLVLPGDQADEPGLVGETPRRPSIAVLPFRNLVASGPYGTLAEGLAHELITELARLR